MPAEIDPALPPASIEEQVDYWMDRYFDEMDLRAKAENKVRSQALDIISYLGQLDEADGDLIAKNRELSQLKALLSWVTGACVDELPHSEISAAIDRALEVPND